MRNRYLVGLLAVGMLACSVAAEAQTSSVNSTPAVKPSYSAAVTALAPAASATDFFTLTGSATKTVRVTSAQCAGISTAAATATVVALKRSTANSAGTSSNLTEVPHDSNLGAATATALAYTANPTTGTLVGNVGSTAITTTTAASSAVSAIPARFEFGSERLQYPVTLRGTTQVFALNGAGASFSAGTALNCDVHWIEE